MQHAFGANRVHEPTLRPDGKIMHAELKIGDSIVMISDASEHAKAMSAMLYVYVPNVDAVYQMALKAGGTSVMEPSDHVLWRPQRRREGPGRQQLALRHHVEDVSPAELKKRATEYIKKQKAA